MAWLWEVASGREAAGGAAEGHLQSLEVTSAEQAFPAASSGTTGVF